MAVTYPRLAQAYATTGGATLYTGPAGGAIIRQIRAVTVGVTVGAAVSDYYRMAHGADYEDNCIVPWTLVAADDGDYDDCFIGVESGELIKLQSSASSTRIVVTVYGVLLA
jgi:hypothetical protein